VVVVLATAVVVVVVVVLLVDVVDCLALDDARFALSWSRRRLRRLASFALWGLYLEATATRAFFLCFLLMVDAVVVVACADADVC
jgi:hypothetical protein